MQSELLAKGFSINPGENESHQLVSYPTVLGEDPNTIGQRDQFRQKYSATFLNLVKGRTGEQSPNGKKNDPGHILGFRMETESTG
jgi:hypothetical protein